MSEDIKRYDDRKNLIYRKSSYVETWYKYDKNNRNNEIHYKYSDRDEFWYKYSENSQVVHYKYFNGDDDNYYKWIRYKRTKITEHEFNHILFLKRKRVPRYEILDI